MTSLCELEFQRPDQTAATTLIDELSDAYLDVFGEPPHDHGAEHARLFRERFALQAHRDGAELVTARCADRLVGFGFGLPLTSSKSWWFDLATDVDPSMTEETPGRTFAVLELGVRHGFRRAGVATRLHDLLLEGRPEHRATLTVRPDAVAAQAFYVKHGWYKVAQKYNPLPESPLFDVLIKELRPAG